ncbi:hypothetical protein [Moorella sp. Hama-1]|uniref:hypothetical protein n=1 Tax=Moorella sp. Hama-1 TaxID=2138101 RepID=UPI000D64438E|nr:hypothetical protein [Moorella sp. Hama-1]MDN5361881.1 hypothetical protein [Moorella sp. (in: firmicutes)]BCV21407.1 hypothetical protein hamaS1_14760 [Moorella sp. Hama-1]
MLFTGLQIKRRPGPIVVAAPHDGDDTDGLSDGNSGLIAARLAEHLGASLVLARNLRRLVDINKDPESLADPRLAAWCRRYQQHIFRSLPLLVLEIHGHISGNFDLEISTGYRCIDASYRQRLELYRRDLQQSIARLWRPEGQLRDIKKPSLGVFPLDQQVKLKATRTYTFHLVRALRLLGFPCYGLHVEIHRYLRLPQPTGPDIHSALVEILSTGLNRFLS